MRLEHFGFFGRKSIAAATRFVCLADDDHPAMNRRLNSLWSAALIAILCAGSLAAVTDSAGSAQAKAKLAALRARIAELTARMGSHLAHGDSLSARGRATEIVNAP